MTTDEYNKLTQFARLNDSIVPVANYAKLLEREEGEIIYMKEAKNRDLALHRCYFSLLSFIHAFLPKGFRMKVPLKNFHRWLQTLKGEYDILFEFKDGTKLLDYHSISFSNMDENEFRNYIKEQLPFIYENLIGVFYKDETYNSVIETIEQEYEKFMVKLYSK